MLNLYVTDEIRRQQAAELERRLELARMVGEAQQAHRGELRGHVAAMLFTLARWIDPCQGAAQMRPQRWLVVTGMQP